MRRLSETFRMKITPLTPIHVGSGDELSPGDYFILDDNGWPVLHAIDVGYLATRLNEAGRTWLSSLINKSPAGWVQTVLSNKPFVEIVRRNSRFQSDVTKRVAAEIREGWGKLESNLSIQTLQRSIVGPFIPGSSIKGALRTALLWSSVDKPMDVGTCRDTEVMGWERRQLGAGSSDIRADPLRFLKVADSSPVTKRTIVVDVELFGTEKGDDIRDYRECFPDVKDDSGFRIYTLLSIDSGHPGYARSFNITRDRIISSCRDFYLRVLEADIQYWQRHDDHVTGVCNQVLARARECPDAGLIRLGWGCGMHGVSLNLAKPRGPQPHDGLDPKFRKDPCTRRLLDDQPPGWALFTLEEV